MGELPARGVGGIYRIVNLKTGRTYIGSSNSVADRFLAHTSTLRHKRHCNPYLQKSWLKHSGNNFVFEHLVECDLESLLSREQEFISAYRDHGLPLYNLKPSVLTRAFRYKHTEETKRKIGLGNKGKPHTFEQRWMNGVAHKGQVISEWHKSRIRAVHTGKKVSIETRLRSSITNRLRRILI